MTRVMNAWISHGISIVINLYILRRKMMPKKISDDFTETLKYRNDLSRLKKEGYDSITLMDYIFIMEKQIQELYKKERISERTEKLP